MDRPRAYHTNWNKSEKGKVYDITYMCNIKEWYNCYYLQNRNWIIDIENKLMVTKGKGKRRTNWEIEIDMCTLLYTKDN